MDLSGYRCQSRITEKLHRENFAALWGVNAWSGDLYAKSITLMEILRWLVAPRA